MRRTFGGGSRTRRIAAAVVVLLILVALAGPFVAPYSRSEIVGIPFAPRSTEHLLGTDFLGRDVLSRVLYGGRSVVVLAGAATVLSYLLGAAVGLLAGYRGGVIDGLLMRTVDVMLAFPPIMFLLMIAAGVGPSALALTLSVAVIFAPGVARVIRSATQAVASDGYVEAAVARGESTPRILFLEIAPNLRSTVVADAGPRFTFAILLVAAVNYLGLGLRPPAADWALMISENRAGLTLQPLALVVPAALVAVLTVAVNVVADGLGTASTSTKSEGSPR